MYEKYIKRMLDFIIALISILILSPLFLILAILVKINLGSPIIFKQERPGLSEKVFTIYKFRTMLHEFDVYGNELNFEQRLTKFGLWLRSTSLDELPELFNILKGDMSFVGPRPLLIRYLPIYNDEQRKRHSVRPGLTGYAQIKGRNKISWREKFNFDVYYIRNISFLVDVKIIWETVKIVFKREGITGEDCLIVEDFNGNN